MRGAIVFGGEPLVEAMFGALGSIDRHVEPEAAQSRTADQDEFGRVATARLGEIAQSGLDEIAARQPREVHVQILRQWPEQSSVADIV